MSPHLDAEVRSILQRLPIKKNEPPICQEIRDRYGALLNVTKEPVKIEEALGFASSVHKMGTARVEGGAVMVAFRGHAVDDGVVIWRTGPNAYHIIRWYDYLD